MLNKTLLGSAAVIMTMVGAQAADLPSKKAAPATYVKICDAYGAGFFFIPGTDTCVQIGGYTRFEYQYTGAKDVLKVDNTTTANKATYSVGQYAATQDTYGTEYRGRIQVDARTPTSMGVARSFISITGKGTTGLRASTITYDKGYAPALSTTNAGFTLESAFVQWAGFTFGIASSNYALMPSITYNANLWSGFANRERQVAYTAVIGGGWSATVALEDKQMFTGDTGSTTINKPDTNMVLTGNIRLDQAWGWAAVHGLVGKNSLGNAAPAVVGTPLDPLAWAANSTITPTTNASEKSTSLYAIGATTGIKLDMIAPGDIIYLTTNYSSGLLGAITANPLGGPNAASSGGRVLGGVLRIDNDVVFDGTSYKNTTAWNVGGQFVHNWMPKWRSVFTAAYAEVNTPTQTQTTKLAWGKGTVWETRGSVIYSPVKDFDIGLEVQYIKNNSKLQNTSAMTASGSTWSDAGYPGLSNSNVTTKLRVERAF